MKKNNHILIISLAIAFVILIFCLPLILGFGKSGAGTMVLERDYSLLSKKEIMNKLKNDFLYNGMVVVTNSGREFKIKLDDISASIDYDKMASTMLYRRLNLGIKNYVMAFLEKKDFELIVTWDKTKLGAEIIRISEQIDKPYIPTEIILEEKIIKIKDGELGVEVDKNELANLIVNKLQKYSMDKSDVIPTKLLGIIPNENEKIEAINLAKKIIEKKVSFNWEGSSNPISTETMISFIGFDKNCNNNKVFEFVSSFSNSVKQSPRDASFKFENNKVISFESSRDGFEVDQNKMNNDICQNLKEWSNSDKIEIKYELPLIKTMAKIKTDEVNDLGIKELIGRGTSSFRHSSEIRNWNVEKGAEIVNRILVAPGETFSFIKNLGEVSLDNGFKKAYVINKGKTVLDVGGGICQVSTTLFRAMLDAGLDITDRKGHAYRVSYYEEDSKPGFDATVFIPNPDLKFINDTGSYVLIQSFYDGVKKTLTYEIYGTKDGRKTEISNYKQWDASAAPPDVWIDDPTLRPGQVVKDESRVPGLKTSFDWKVTKEGEILHQKTYVTNYVPWAAVYRRGPQI